MGVPGVICDNEFHVHVKEGSTLLFLGPVRHATELWLMPDMQVPLSDASTFVHVKYHYY